MCECRHWGRRTIRGIDYAHTSSMSARMDHEGKSKDWNYGARENRFGRQSSGFPFRLVEVEVLMRHSSDSTGWKNSAGR